MAGVQVSEIAHLAKPLTGKVLARAAVRKAAIPTAMMHLAGIGVISIAGAAGAAAFSLRPISAAQRTGHPAVSVWIGNVFRNFIRHHSTLLFDSELCFIRYSPLQSRFSVGDFAVIASSSTDEKSAAAHKSEPDTVRPKVAYNSGNAKSSAPVALFA